LPSGPLHRDSYFFKAPPSTEDVFRSIDEHLAGGGSLDDHEVKCAIYQAFFNVSIPDASQLPADEVDFVFGPRAVAGRHDPEVVAARAALYSTRSYFATPYRLKREVFPEPYEELGPETYSLDVDPEFIRLAMRLKPYILADVIEIAPSASTFVSAGGRSFANSRHPQLLDVLLEDEVRGALPKDGVSAVEIPLRALAGPPERVLEVRSEYGEQFAAFQQALAGMISTGPERGEEALAESMQLVGEEVGRLDEQMEKLRRQAWFDAGKLALTPLPLLLPILLPPPLGAVIEVATGLMGGGYGAIDFVQQLKKRRKRLRLLRRDPFYVPWLLRGPSQ
jgi:hypothetical protein